MRRASLAQPELFRGADERARPRRRGILQRLRRRAIREVSAKLLYPVPGIHRLYDRSLRRDLTLSEAEIPVAALPRSLDGLRLLLITDVHAGPFIGRAALREAFDRLLECSPHAILLGGDMTGGNAKQLGRHGEAFEALRAPLGVFAVPGNHDYVDGRPEPWGSLAREFGITMLSNRSVPLERGGASLTLAGVDDLQRGKPDLAAAMRKARPPVVLLSHNPDLLPAAAKHGVALMLSGHTHGGQVRIRGLPLSMRQSRYRLNQGRYRAGETELIVSRGLGAVGIPLRVGCPPEAVLVTLRRRGQVSTLYRHPGTK